MMISVKNSAGRQSGYILLTLLLVLALMAIAAAVVAPKLAFEIRRDREEEMIHRGVQYARAIRMFVKKNGRYPGSTDELVKSHFLRKRYKDPIANKEFKLLTIDDVMRAVGQPTALGGIASNLNASGQNPDATNPDGSPNGSDSANAAGTSNNGTNAQNATGSQSGFGPQNALGAQGGMTSPNGMASGLQSGAVGPQTSGFNNGSSGQNGQVIGAQIAGVASTSKAVTIREFNHKKHYNEWYFFYQPNYDTPYQVKGPTPLVPSTQTALQGAQPIQGQSPQGLQPQGMQLGAPQQSSPSSQ
jgi:type II secretory pathway pseudopilin PulG